jgi:hypothetical protein
MKSYRDGFFFIRRLSNNQSICNLRLVIVLLSIINCIGVNSLYGQEKKDHEKRLPLFTGRQLIGIQFNPLFTKDYKTAGYTASLRYGYKITDPITLGVEASGYFFNDNGYKQGQEYEDDTGIGFGIIARYSSPARKRVQFFLELSPIYHIYVQDTTETIQYNGSTFAIYLAPGLTLYSRNRKFSFDLYYKVSTQSFSNSRHTILAYKLNYHFK